MPLSDIVNVIISVESAQLEREGFGVPCVLGFSNRFTDLAREYTSTAGMVDDGFLTTDAEYKMVSAIFAQTPRPPRVIVAKRGNRPTMRWAVTPVVVNSAAYQLRVDGNLVSFTSGIAATATEIIAGLKAAIDPLATGLVVSDQVTSMRLLATLGAYHTIEAVNPALLGVAQDHADAGIAADLNALKAFNNTWYGLLSADASKASIEAAAAWVETNKKLYIADSQDSAIETANPVGATDVAATLKTAAYARTAIAYHRSNAAQFASSWMGRVFPIDAGRETWAFKTLAGVPALLLTDTQSANIKAKNANEYVAIFGRNLTLEGKVAAGEFIDVVRGVDWLTADIGERCFIAIASPGEKLPYDDGGVSIIKNQIHASLAEGINRNFLKSDPEPIVTAPLVIDINPADRAERHLPDVRFEAWLAGAIQSVTITGVVRA